MWLAINKGLQDTKEFPIWTPYAKVWMWLAINKGLQDTKEFPIWTPYAKVLRVQSFIGR